MTDVNEAALGILHERGGADEVSGRHECEVRGYHFGGDKFREIMEDLVADELVRVTYEDPAWAEERYMEDPRGTASGPRIRRSTRRWTCEPHSPRRAPLILRNPTRLGKSYEISRCAPCPASDPGRMLRNDTLEPGNTRRRRLVVGRA